MRIVLITAALPPRLDGIGDYTANLAKELAQTHEVVVLTGIPVAEQIPCVQVVQAFDATVPRSVGMICQHVEDVRPDWIVLQYCPFAFGRWGWNPYLPLALRRIERKVPSVMLATTVHEPMAWPINWKLRLMNVWQGPLLRAVCRASDKLFVVVGRWAKQYRRWFGPHEAIHLPVGSNVPLAELTSEEARRLLELDDRTVVMAVFGQGHHSQLWELAGSAVRQARSQGANIVVLHLGPRVPRLEVAFAGLPIRSYGYLPAREVAQRLRATDVFLAPFADGVSTRRTTMMAALQHGLAVVGTRGVATDDVLLDAHDALLLTECGDEAGFTRAVIQLASDPLLRSRLGSAAEWLYQQHFRWEMIAAKLTSVLDAAGRESTNTPARL